MTDDGNASLPPNVTLKNVDVQEPAMFTGEVSLADGTVLRLRVVVNGVQRLDGIKDPTGLPMYMVNTVVIPSVKETKA
jgi:hypothetical protein